MNSNPTCGKGCQEVGAVCPKEQPHPLEVPRKPQGVGTRVPIPRAAGLNPGCTLKLPVEL